ncbi:hypothetical protein BDQ17DRAFT_279199 [Cyathus striatus]|nr:hypothetical protein BDQ17DRAFT_279199 [Cyathus striatus]
MWDVVGDVHRRYGSMGSPVIASCVSRAVASYSRDSGAPFPCTLYAHEHETRYASGWALGDSLLTDQIDHSHIITANSYISHLSLLQSILFFVVFLSPPWSRFPSVQEAIEKEWSQFVLERAEGMQEIQALRQKVADVEAKDREKAEADEEMDVDENREREKESKNIKRSKPEEKEALTNDVTAAPEKEEKKDREGDKEKEKEREKDNDAMHPDDEDAVEY